MKRKNLLRINSENWYRLNNTNSSDEIKIDLGNSMAEVKITDVFGRTIANLNTNQKQYVIDVSQYANGTYYVKSASITSSFTVHH